jgi:hypothetical protein
MVVICLFNFPLQFIREQYGEDPALYNKNFADLDQLRQVNNNEFLLRLVKSMPLIFLGKKKCNEV